MEIVIPKSKLLDVKRLVGNFNSQMKKVGLPLIVSSYSQPFKKIWFVSELDYDGLHWKNKGIKKEVVLIKVGFNLTQFDDCGIDFYSYIDTSSVVLDPLTAKVEFCNYVAFTSKPFVVADVNSVFANDGTVICSKCSVVRNRQSVFQCIDSDMGVLLPISYSCLQGKHALSPQKLVLWQGYFKHVFTKLISQIQSESRIKLIVNKPTGNDVFGINSFISLVRDQTITDGCFYSAKYINSTSSIVLKKLVNGHVGPIYKDVAKYHDFMASFVPKPGFEYNVKRAYYNAKKNGVGESNAALVSISYVLYRSKCSDLVFDDEPLFLGAYSGVLVPFLEERGLVYLRDAFDRVFSVAADLVPDFIQSGDVVFVSSKIQDLAPVNGRLVHKLDGFELFTL